MNIVLIPNYAKGVSRECTDEIYRILDSKDVNLKIKEYENSGEYIAVDDADIVSADVLVAIGGDGTIIHTAKIAAELNKPILGVNSGKLGFTAGVEKSELELISKIVDGNFETEKRSMIDVKLVSENEDEENYSALNDVVVSCELSKIIDFSMAIGDNKPYEYRADGFIMATPTGSTAYSLSAGGPVIEPTMECMIYTPICPHSLFNRSVIFDSDTVLNVSFGDNKSRLFLTVDGESAVSLNNEDKLVFSKSALSADFIRLSHRNFYDTLNMKIIETEHTEG